MTASTLPPAAESHVPSRLPGAARLPSEFGTTERTDPLVSLADRVGALSDELNDPDGLIHQLFARAEARAEERHAQVMAVLREVVNNQLEALARLDRLEPRVDEHEARLRLVPAGQQQ